METTEYKAHMKRFLNYETNTTLNFSNDTVFGWRLGEQWYCVLFKSPCEGTKIDHWYFKNLSLKPSHHLKRKKKRKKKKDELSLSKSSWLFCLKGAEGSSPPSGSRTWSGRPICFTCPHSSQPFITPATTVLSMHFQWHRGLDSHNLHPVLLQLRFFVFNIYLVKMSIGCFYGL